MFELTFLKLGLLWGAAGVAAPIVVHLVMRQKPRLVPFPALRFVRASHLASMRRHQLKHLLLLILRCLLILLLALVLARPLLKSDLFTADLTTPVRAVFLFDDSYSMSYDFAGKTRLDEAKTIALNVLDALPAGSEVTVITTSDPEADTTFDRPTVRSRIADLDTADVPSVCYAGLERAYELLGKTTGPKRREIFLFTDMTEVGWRGIDTLKPKTAEDVGLYVIDVGVKENRNVVLGGLALSRQTIGENAKLTLTATITAGDVTGRRVVELYLAQHAKKDQQEVTVQPGQTAQVHFDPVFRASGLHQGKVVIRERDAIGADNAAYFTVTVTPAPRVLVLSGEGGTRGSAGEAFFLETALSPPALRRQHRELVRCEVVEPAALAGRRLSDYAAIVLANVERLPAADWGRLNQYVFNGGGLALFAGGRVTADDYNGVAAADLMPGTLGAVVSPPEGVALSVQQYDHPILARFEDGANGDLGAPLFARYILLIRLKPSARVVVAFSDGAPALTEHDHGRGRVLFFTATADVDWTDFPRFPSYPVFVHQMIDRLGGVLRDRRNFVVGQTVRLGLPPEYRGAMLTGLAPGRPDSIPLGPEATGRAVLFPHANRVGNYRIEVRKEDLRDVFGFSVNPWTEESRLDRVEREAVARQFPAGGIVFAASREELATAFTRLRVGKEVFPYLLLMLLVISVAESYLANRFYRREGLTAPETET